MFMSEGFERCSAGIPSKNQPPKRNAFLFRVGKQLLKTQKWIFVWRARIEFAGDTLETPRGEK